ncbi:MAG: DUF853 domain-containing protein, partial [Intrasporangium sp.]|nr:DUF853 domain-containing protein [Intrasporangium sp.]
QAAPAPEAQPESAPAPAASTPATKDEPSLIEKVVESQGFRSMLRSAGTVIGREITRSIFGTSRRRR